LVPSPKVPSINQTSNDTQFEAVFVGIETLAGAKKHCERIVANKGFGIASTVNLKLKCGKWRANQALQIAQITPRVSWSK
jgi:hypothetical protein